MTTNARDEKWSEWIDWSGGSAPLAPAAFVEVKTRDGDIEDGEAVAFYWLHDREPSDIIAYRYKIKEPESDMHPDLKWLAENVSEWNDNFNFVQCTRLEGSGPMPIWWQSHNPFRYAKAEWQAARQKLGLDPTGIADPDEEECLQLAYGRWGDESVPTSVKQLRYQDAKGEDWIDEFSRTATVDEFRGAMRFTIGKYNRRAGKKDELIKEIEKMRDYCERWLEYERKVGQ